MGFGNFLQTRRGIHGLVAVSMLIGFTIVVAGLLFTVLLDYGDIATNNAQCVISDKSLHITGVDRVYFVMSLHNLGSNTITSANVTFVDNSGVEYGFRNDSLQIAPGTVWSMMDSFPAILLKDDTYAIRAITVSNDGSVVDCSTAS